jgi:regulator of protease activity HflC (stomatin/prohibitin superfamily)
MESALAWIGHIAEWIGQWFPRWKVLDTTEGAIKYVRGIPKLCLPGRVHWYWPVTTLWQPYPTARQTDRLETQTMETKDGKTFIVAGTITYCVPDLMALVTTTHSPAATVVELSASAVHDICCDFDWETLQREQRLGTLKTKLKNEAQKQLKDYGVTVIKLQLTNLARARVLKVSQSVANEEN